MVKLKKNNTETTEPVKTKKRKTKTEITVPVVSTFHQGNGPVSGEHSAVSPGFSLSKKR